MTMQRQKPWRRRQAAFLATLILLLISSVVARGAEYASVKKDGVNIRAGASDKEEILWEVFKDFPLQVLQHQGTWTQIKDFEGDTGWISSALLDKKQTVIVKVQIANLRSGPGQNYDPVATVKSGVVFDLVQREGDWLQLRHTDGTEGWIFSTLVWPNP